MVSTEVYVEPSLNFNTLVMVVVFYPFFTDTDVEVFTEMHPGGT